MYRQFMSVHECIFVIVHIYYYRVGSWRHLQTVKLHIILFYKFHFFVHKPKNERELFGRYYWPLLDFVYIKLLLRES